MEYFELPQLRVDNEAHIKAMDEIKDKFQPVDLNYDGHQVTYEPGVPTDENEHKWVYYQDRDHGARFGSIVQDIVDETARVLNIPKELIVRQQYTKMKPGWSLAIHRDVARQVALLIEFKKDAKGGITWYDDSGKETKQLTYSHPVVVNTRQLHSAVAGNGAERYGFQIDFNYDMGIDEIYKYYKQSPVFEMGAVKI
ncbi:MAG: hypothetical protein CMA64_04980 [Euryarchaeota archaeon]|nr:hypothetical protein [Euryarchaeota archaeon]